MCIEKNWKKTHQNTSSGCMGGGVRAGGGARGEPQGGDQDSQDSRCLPLGAPPRPALDLCSRVCYLQHFSRQLVFKITEESERAPVFTSVPLGLHWGGACTCDDIGRDSALSLCTYPMSVMPRFPLRTRAPSQPLLEPARPCKAFPSHARPLLPDFQEAFLF